MLWKLIGCLKAISVATGTSTKFHMFDLVLCSIEKYWDGFVVLLELKLFPLSVLFSFVHLTRFCFYAPANKASKGLIWTLFVCLSVHPHKLWSAATTNGNEIWSVVCSFAWFCVWLSWMTFFIFMRDRTTCVPWTQYNQYHADFWMSTFCLLW